MVVLFNETKILSVYKDKDRNDMKLHLFFVIILMLVFSACEDNSTNSDNSGNPPANEVWMRGLAFTPSSITVSAGTTVKWTNKESTSHTVTSTSQTPLFSSGTLGNGGTFSFTFDTPGTYPYRCTLHSGMNGTVVVQ